MVRLFLSIFLLGIFFSHDSFSSNSPLADSCNAPTGVSATNSSICKGSNTTLNVAGSLSTGATWRWYKNGCGTGHSIGNGASLSVSPNTTITYYVRAENGTCISTCSSIEITVIPLPSNPSSATASSTAICSGSATTLMANGNLSAGATWVWYSLSCGGTPIGTGSPITVSPSSTITYYLRAENGTCSSSCKNIKITVDPTPDPPVSASASPDSICSGSSTTISVNGTLSSGASWHWYSGTCDGSNVGTGATRNVSPTSSTTYFVRAENSNCVSACQNTSVIVLSSPAGSTSASASPNVVCAGSSSTLNVSGVLSPGADWHWYSDACGLTIVGTGVSVPVTPSQTTTYYVRAENEYCSSACRAVTVTVGGLGNPLTISASSNSICSGTSVTLTVTGSLSPGSSWHWYSGGCAVGPAGTGNSINVSPALTTTYYVRAENGNCLSSCLNTTVNVTTTPTSAISVNASPASVCGGSSSSLSVNGSLTPGASWRWYSSSCGGSSAGSGTSISVSPSTTRTYYVRAENGNCLSPCQSTLVTVNAAPDAPVSATPSSTLICAGLFSTITVDGTLSPGAEWHWYSGSCGGNDIGTGNSVNVSPASSTRYYVRAENGNCFSSCEHTTVDALPSPEDPQPVNVSADSICIGETSILSEPIAQPTGSDWYWFTGTCGGTLIGQGNYISVSPATDMTYYVRGQSANCQSFCLNITVHVYPPAIIPIISVSNDSLSVGTFLGYEWFRSRDNITYNFIGNDPKQPLTSPGYYFVAITDFNGCTATSDTLYIQETVVYNNPGNTISAFTDASENFIIVSFKQFAMLKPDYKIYNETGSVVKEGRLENNHTSISMDGLSQGIYILRITSESESFVKKFMKY